jgi:hypothetical protein
MLTTLAISLDWGIQGLCSESAEWVKNVVADPEWRDLKNLRDKLVHRRPRMAYFFDSSRGSRIEF